MRNLSSERARGLVIQVIRVVLRLGVGVTWAKVITLSPADPFMLPYQREAGYAGHNSSSSVHTSQGSSSRFVFCGGHSGHSGSSH